MANRNQSFENGAIIYREGQDGDCAYEVLTGSVELLRDDGDGLARTSLLQAGQMFGEMGLVGGGPREATARAVGPVRVRMIQRDQGGETASAGKKKGLLSRFVDQLSAPPEPEPKTTTPSSHGDQPAADGGPGFIQRVMDRVQPLEGRLEARIARLSGDVDGQQTRRVAQAFDRFRDIHAKPLGKVLEVDLDKDLFGELGRVERTARRWLRSQQADVLIWGHVPAPGVTLHLHFVTRATADERNPGAFDLTTDLPLPADVPEPFSELLRAVTLAACVPMSREKATMRAATLPEAITAARSAMEVIPDELTTRERASLHLCYGNAVATTWALARPLSRSLELLNQAIGAYKTVTSTVTIEESAIDWAMAHRHLASLLYSRAEASDEASGFDESAAAALSALEVLSREETPYAWAALQHRLGLIHFKLGFENGHTGVLRQALRCHQNALKVYTRRKATDQWAEVMSSFAQAAQVFGEHVKSLDALATAVNACTAVLQVRDVNKAPMAWAATQNNLGSALFLLGKKANNPDRVEAAIKAFEMALGVYERRNAHRAAAVTAKNRDRAQRLLEYMLDSPVASKEIPPGDMAHLEQPMTPSAGGGLVDVTDIGAGLHGASRYH